MNEFLSRSRAPQPERGVRDRALKWRTIFALMAPQFSSPNEKSRFQARLRLESLLAASARVLQPRGKIALWASRIPESSSSWGRLDAGATPAHPRARAPLTDPGSEHAARFAKGTSVRSANPWAGPCTATFAHEGRQPWPPVRAHSPDKLPVALRSKHSRQLAAVAAGGCLRLCLRQRVSCYPFAAKRSTTESEILAATCFPPQTGLGIL